METEKRLETKIHETEKRLEEKIYQVKSEIQETEKRLESKIYENEKKILYTLVGRFIAILNIILAFLQFKLT